MRKRNSRLPEHKQDALSPPTNSCTTALENVSIMSTTAQAYMSVHTDNGIAGGVTMVLVAVLGVLYAAYARRQAQRCSVIPTGDLEYRTAKPWLVLSLLVNCVGILSFVMASRSHPSSWYLFGPLGAAFCMLSFVGYWRFRHTTIRLLDRNIEYTDGRNTIVIDYREIVSFYPANWYLWIRKTDNQTVQMSFAVARMGELLAVLTYRVACSHYDQQASGAPSGPTT